MDKSLNLVYKVYPLPESMFYYLWNYDKLDESDEYNYIIKILNINNAKIFTE